MNQMLPPTRKIGKTQRTGVVAGLDIGCSKIACLIAHSDGTHDPVIKGVGVQASSGMRRGEVVDIDALSISIGKAVEDAEKFAGFSIDSVCVNISGGKPKAQMHRHQIPINQRVTAKDIESLFRLDMDYPSDDDRLIIHRIPLHYTLDGVSGIHTPLAMYGTNLGLDIAVITAASSTIQNLTTAVERNHLSIDGFCPSAYAAGLASLTQDEKDLGTVILEMGSGVTSMAVFIDGQLTHLDSIPLGGSHVTADIARTLSTPMIEAERIKTLHGNVLTALGDTDELITLPRVGIAADSTNANSHQTDAAQQIELGLLGEIIRPRVEEIAQILMARMEKAGFSRLANHRLVITGGAAQIPGLAPFLHTLFDRSTRLGAPIRLIGMADAMRGPAFATTAGLLHFSASTQIKHSNPTHAPRQNLFSKVGAWLNTHL